eukprot:6740105-Prymnesium_polylepis.1
MGPGTGVSCCSCASWVAMRRVCARDLNSLMRCVRGPGLRPRLRMAIRRYHRVGVGFLERGGPGTFTILLIPR